MEQLDSWFHDIRLRDVALVGGKNASLGELYRELALKVVRIPNGFAVTARGYWLSYARRASDPGR